MHVTNNGVFALLFPRTAQSAAPPPPKVAAVNVPKPGIHVRWSVPLAQPKRNSSSIPGQRDESYPKNTRGPSQRPADKPTDAQLRAAMEASSSTASSSKASSSKTSSSKASSSKTPSAQPAVPIPAKPKNAPRGSRLCPYCNQWMPNGHDENCQSMPYEFWIWATQQRQIVKYGEDVINSWDVQCQHCATPFPAPASKRVHLSGCERRRNAAGLPLNLYSAIRKPNTPKQASPA